MKPLFRVLVSGAALLALGAALPARAEMFARSTMKEVDLHGFKVWLGRPVQITAQEPWASGGNGPNGEQMAWAFAHPIASLHRMPGGNLLVTYSMCPDTQTPAQWVSSFQTSADGGEHWERRYNVLMMHNPATVFALDGNMLALSSELLPTTAGNRRSFVAPTYLFEGDGNTMVFQANGMKIPDWPYAVELHPNDGPPENWHVGLSVYGNGLQIGTRLLATAMSFVRQPDGRRAFHNLLIASEDGGRTWRYFSTIANYDPALAAEKGYEGPNESYMIRLPGGELMAVFRIGNGRKIFKIHRTFSEDGGKTWSPAEALPAFSVKPSLLRLDNGTIVLSTGRPGIKIWFADDPHGGDWQEIDLVKVHNAWAPDPTFQIIPGEDATAQPWNKYATTTCYTSLLAVGPGRFLITYDRCPLDRGPARRGDMTRIFVVPVEVERN